MYGKLINIQIVRFDGAYIKYLLMEMFDNKFFLFCFVFSQQHYVHAQKAEYRELYSIES